MSFWKKKAIKTQVDTTGPEREENRQVASRLKTELEAANQRVDLTLARLRQREVEINSAPPVRLVKVNR